MINKVTLIGNLGRDPEVKHFDSGTAVAKFSVATNENYKDKAGNWQSQTEWHEVVAWRSLADKAEKDLKKGSLVYVEGRLRTRKYTDSSGIERTITEVEALQLKSLDKKERSGLESGNTGTISNAGNTMVGSALPPDLDQNVEDDLPF